MIDFDLARGIPAELRSCDNLELVTRQGPSEVLDRLARIGVDGGLPLQYRQHTDIAIVSASATVNGETFVLRGSGSEFWRQDNHAIWRGIVLPPRADGSGCRVRARAVLPRLTAILYGVFLLWLTGLSLWILIRSPFPASLFVIVVIWVVFGIMFMVQRDRAAPVSRGLLLLLSLVIEADSGECA
jgi:hypothetical protein